MKKILIGIAVLAVAAGTAVFMYRDRIGMMIAFGRLKPEVSFAEATPPAAPDYSLTASWAALPDREDLADVVPNGEVQDRQATAEVDVFFVQPTTFFGTAGWNQSLDDVDDQSTHRHVRPARPGIGLQQLLQGLRAALSAGDDLLFHGSLGQWHGGAATRVRRRATRVRLFPRALQPGAAVHPRLRTARARCTSARCSRSASPARHCATGSSPRTPIGFGIDREEMAKAVPDVPVCESAEQIGCLVAWNAVGPQAMKGTDTSRNICVNPLTWRADGTAAEASLNLGGVAYPGHVRRHAR